MKIKRKVRQLLSPSFVGDIGKLDGSIQNADVISFDIFDTLVKRTVTSPEQIHYIVQEKYKRIAGVKAENYALDRMKAEKKALYRSKYEEIQLSEILCCLPDKYKEDIDLLFNLEVETEIEKCCAKKHMQSYYKIAVRLDKHIVLTSDMYLPQNVIEEILKKCNYSEYEKLFLSSAYRKKKSTGHLFDEVLSVYSPQAYSILHIGDNLLGDYLMPKGKGITAFLIRSCDKA